MDVSLDHRLIAQPAAPPPGEADAALLPLLARLAGAVTPEEGARAILGFLAGAFGPGFGGEVALRGPRPEVVAAMEPLATGAAQAGEAQVRWTKDGRVIGHLVAHGLGAADRDRLAAWAPWLQPAVERLAAARQALAAAGLERRQAQAWRFRADILTLAQEPTNVDAFVRRVVELAARQLDALQVAFWAYEPAEDALESRFASSSCIEQPVPAALFEAVVAERQPRTVALPDQAGSLRTFVLAPVFDDQALLGVFQLVPRRPALDPALEATLAAIADATAAGLRAVGAFERLSFQASHDPLTGLANRRTFEAFIDREIKLAERHGTPLSVVVLDVDHFKRYNDTYGHPAGDALLKALGARLAQVVRTTDFVARYGGEEFVIVLPHTDQAGALAAAHKILEGVRVLPEHAEVLGGRVTASLGVASFPGDVFDARELFQAADQAMYRAKHAGRDRVCQGAG